MNKQKIVKFYCERAGIEYSEHQAKESDRFTNDKIFQALYETIIKFGTESILLANSNQEDEQPQRNRLPPKHTAG